MKSTGETLIQVGIYQNLMKKVCLLFIFWAADYEFRFTENEWQLLYLDEMYCPLFNTQNHSMTIFVKIFEP